MRNSGRGAPTIRLLGLLGISLMIATCRPTPTAVSGASAKPAPPLDTPALLAPDRAADRRLFSAAALQPFFVALRRLEEKQSARPVRVLQIGDSHTAADAFSGRMREAFQDRFGAAGRGWLPAGVPFKHYNPRLVTVAATGWRHLGPASGAPPEALGLDAGLAESEQPGAAMTLVSGEAAGFDRLAVEFLAQPAGGDLAVRVDRRAAIRVPTAAPRIGIVRAEIAIGEAAREVELSGAGPAPARLIGWTVERRGPGVIYENHGTIGAKMTLLGRMSRAAVARELADSRPALLIVAFGTNEGFDDDLDLHRYAADFRRNLDALQRMAPRTAVLVLGPPDGNRIEGSCPREKREGCVSAAAAADPCAWREPPNLAAVRRIQKRVAAQQGRAFWDWSQAMGGACSMHRLLVHDPPWAFPDHVHLNKLGYGATADVLFFDLINEYEKWKKSRPVG
jgi:lysophospholipase L1-like esterase